MAKAAAKKDEAEQKPARKGMFAKFAKVDEAVGGGDLNNFEVNLGSNKCRVISDPILIRKHWDLPASSELVVVPCAKVVDPEKYAEAAENGELDEYLDTLADCPYCELAKAHPGFYVVKDHWVFNVVQDGLVKVAEFTQRSILRAIAKFEEDEEWAPLMPNGLVDIEINITKEQTGPKPQNVKYSVGGVPTSKPLSDEQLENYRNQAIDLMALKAPPDPSTDEGKAKWAEYLSQAGTPKEGEKSKKLA